MTDSPSVKPDAPAARPAIQLVVFDLGGVLIEVARDWTDAARRAGYDPQLFAPRRPGAELDMQDLWKAHDTGKMTTAQAYTQVARIADVPVETIYTIGAAWLADPYPGVTELLTELKARGVTTACMSNTNAQHWDAIHDQKNPAYLPLHLLTHRFASQLVGYTKPSPAIYAHVEQATGVTAPHILYFEDMQPNVVAAARRGWHAVAVNPDRAADPIQQVRRALAQHQVL